MSYSLSFSQAIMVVMFVADKIQQGIYDFVPTRELSKSLNIARPTATKILNRLSRARIIETREGAKGGVRLAVTPSAVTVLNIFDAIESGRPLFRTDLQVRAAGEKPARAQQEIAGIFYAAENAMKASLSETTIAELLEKLNQ